MCGGCGGVYSGNGSENKLFCKSLVAFCGGGDFWADVFEAEIFNRRSVFDCRNGVGVF